MAARLVQLQKGSLRRVAIVREPLLELLDADSVYRLAQSALAEGVSFAKKIELAKTQETLDYDSVYSGKSEWKLLPCFDHPGDSAHCLVSGTGLTHLGSAQNRDDMHRKTLDSDESALSDSMKMFRWGLEKGKPTPGKIGIAPEWFFKGTGEVLRAHNAPLDILPFAEGGGEEAEIAGLYLIDGEGRPVRVGMAQGNEFSDHVFEKPNYLNLAGSKLRTCSIGPELVVDPEFGSVAGETRILREGKELWSKPQLTGEREMSHSLSNMEHHHFKFPHHRVPGDVHVHYFGTSGTSFGAGIRLQDGDVMEIRFDGFGRPLCNPLRKPGAPDALVAVRALH